MLYGVGRAENCDHSPGGHEGHSRRLPRSGETSPPTVRCNSSAGSSIGPRSLPNPAAKGTVDYFKEQQRDRFMEAGEIPKFFKALEAEANTTVRDFVKVSLSTGRRRSNVQSMR